MDENTKDVAPIVGFITASKQEFESEESKTLTFVLQNKSDQDVKVLTWYTPLEGIVNDHETPIESPCLLVKRNDGEEVEYDGKMKKRQENPPEEAYINLKGGASISVDFDLNQAYQVSLEGDYSVNFIGKPETVEGSIEFKFAGEEFEMENALTLEQKIEMPQVNFTVKENSVNESSFTPTATRPTEGDIARESSVESLNETFEESQSSEKKNDAPGSAKKAAGAKVPIIISEPDPQKKQQTIDAHNNGYDLVVAILSTLGNNANYTEWFGVFDNARFNAVKNNYTLVRDRMQDTTFTYDLSGAGCTPGVFAYTYKGTTKVWMCGAFWTAPTLGTDSKAGTVVHELSHAVARTDDITYGQSSCRQLAINNPDQAVKNADNHEYCAGG